MQTFATFCNICNICHISLSLSLFFVTRKPLIAFFIIRAPRQTSTITPTPSLPHHPSLPACTLFVRFLPSVLFFVFVFVFVFLFTTNLSHCQQNKPLTYHRNNGHISTINSTIIIITTATAKRPPCPFRPSNANRPHNPRHTNNAHNFPNKQAETYRIGLGGRMYIPILPSPPSSARSSSTRNLSKGPPKPLEQGIRYLQTACHRIPSKTPGFGPSYSERLYD